MLWLSGLMGLMAVGMFTLLWFLPVRRTADDDAVGDGADAAPTFSLLTETAEAPPEPETAELAEAQDDDSQDDICETDASDRELAASQETHSEYDVARVADAEDAEAPSDEAVPDWFATLAASLLDQDANLHADASPQADDEEEAEVIAVDLDAEGEAAMDPETDMDEWFLLGAGTADFEDFDPEEDDLVVIWDDAQGDVPSVEVVRNDEDPAITRVLMGDVILAQFRTRADIRYDELSMVPLSTARSLGWAQL